MNPMRYSSPCEESIEIIASYTVKKLQWINPIGLSAPWDDSPESIAL